MVSLGHTIFVNFCVQWKHKFASDNIFEIKSSLNRFITYGKNIDDSEIKNNVLLFWLITTSF